MYVCKTIIMSCRAGTRSTGARVLDPGTIGTHASCVVGGTYRTVRGNWDGAVWFEDVSLSGKERS
jgi:hypothetical protein